MRSASCVVCVLIETMKLYQAPWAVHIRTTAFGSLVFGHAFSFENLAAYSVGVAGALGVEKTLRYLSFSRQL